MTPPRAADRPVLSAADRAWQMGLTKEEGEVAFLAAKHCSNGGPTPEAIIKRSRAPWRRQIQLLQLAWRIHESGGEGVMAVTEATEKLRGAIREHLEEQPHATWREIRDALEAAGVDTGGEPGFRGYHVRAVREELGIDPRKVQSRAGRISQAVRENGAAPAARREERSEEPEGAEPPAAAEEAAAPPPAAPDTPAGAGTNTKGGDADDGRTVLPDSGSGADVATGEAPQRPDAAGKSREIVQNDGTASHRGAVASSPTTEPDDDFDAAAHAREIVAKGARQTGTLEDRSREIFYGTGRPDLAEAARRVLDAYEQAGLNGFDNWVGWYSEMPDDVLRALRLRIALGMPVPEDLAPLLALGREAAA